MTSPRQLRALALAEIAVVLAASVVALPIPVVIPLLVAASLSLWLRGRSWFAVLRGPAVHAATGAAAGALALVISLALGTPIVERITGGAVQWSMYPIVRGSPGAFLTVALLVAISALAAELVLRGWIVERVLELRGPPAAAVVVGAVIEALLVFPLAGGDPGPFGIDGDLTGRIGAGVFGVAMGWMYVAAGRSALAPLCARMTFVLGALALEAVQVVG